ncbi:MAG TPA: DUF2283 domain-containing protein [Chthonomonadaceae bacterium]|nr:DUF2283 domain-containing protein [Chthonomonadaceae bacterium]
MIEHKHSTAHYVLEKDEFVEGEETLDSTELTRKVVEALQEATRQARQEKHKGQRLVYDAQDDTLLIRLAEGETVRTEEVEPGVLFYYDAVGRVLSIDLLHASTRIPRQEEKSAA